MKILVTNDDGIHAPGLWTMVAELKKVGQVTVVAPDREQSGVGTSVTLHHPLRIKRVKALLPQVEAYSIEGTPADSVILALGTVLKDGVDLVASGINEGPNLGNDVFISGTVGAALQGYFYGLPSLAISVAGLDNPYFDTAARLAGLLATMIRDSALSGKLLLNVNLPNLPPEEIKGIEITRLGERSYADVVQEGHDGRRNYYWIVRGTPQWHKNEGSDVWALEQDRISITPMGFNSASGSIRSLLQELSSKLLDALRA